MAINKSYRHVLKGRNSNDEKHPITGKAPVYSNYSLFNTSHVLDDAPLKEVKLGADRPYSQPNHMERLYGGLYEDLSPLKNPGEGPQTNYYYNTTIHAGLPSARALNDPGHAPRDLYYGSWTNFFHAGLSVNKVLVDPGHERRYNTSFGAGHAPYIYKGVTGRPLDDAGHLRPTNPDGLYGHNHINEWFGLPSARAL